MVSQQSQEKLQWNSAKSKSWQTLQHIAKVFFQRKVCKLRKCKFVHHNLSLPWVYTVPNSSERDWQANDVDSFFFFFFLMDGESPFCSFVVIFSDTWCSSSFSFSSSSSSPPPPSSFLGKEIHLAVKRERESESVLMQVLQMVPKETFWPKINFLEECDASF